MKRMSGDRRLLLEVRQPQRPHLELDYRHVVQLGRLPARAARPPGGDMTRWFSKGEARPQASPGDLDLACAVGWAPA